VDVDDDQLTIGRRAQRWRFEFPAEIDRVRHDAVRAAASFVREHDDLLSEAVAPANATQHAVLAVRLHDAFVRHDDETGRSVVVDAEPSAVQVILTSRLSPREPR
jgi:hypothetical protein